MVDLEEYVLLLLEKPEVSGETPRFPKTLGFSRFHTFHGPARTKKSTLKGALFMCPAAQSTSVKVLHGGRLRGSGSPEPKVVKIMVRRYYEPSTFSAPRCFPNFGPSFVCLGDAPFVRCFCDVVCWPRIRLSCVWTTRCFLRESCVRKETPASDRAGRAGHE